MSTTEDKQQLLKFKAEVNAKVRELFLLSGDAKKIRSGFYFDTFKTSCHFAILENEEMRGILDVAIQNGGMGSSIELETSIKAEKWYEHFANLVYDIVVRGINMAETRYLETWPADEEQSSEG